MAWDDDRWHYKYPDRAPENAAHCSKKCGTNKRATPEHGRGMRYLACWLDANGRVRKKSFEFAQDRDDLITELNAKKGGGRRYDRDAGKDGFETFARRTVDRKRIQQQSKDTYLRDLRHGFDEFGGVSMADLARHSPGFFEDFLAELDLSPAGCQRVYDRHCEIFDRAMKYELIDRNPLRIMDRPAFEPVVRDVLATDQVRAVRDEMDERYRLAVDLGGGVGGARRGEIIALGPDDVNWLRFTATIQRQIKTGADGGPVFALPKRGQVRTVAVTEAMSHRMSAHVQAYAPVAVTLPWERDQVRPVAGEPKTGEPVTVRLFLSNEKGRSISPDRAGTLWGTAADRAGVRQDRQAWHATRHWYASMLLANGMDLAQVAMLMGDRVATVQKRYVHYIPAGDHADTRWRKLTALDDLLEPTGNDLRVRSR